MKKVHFLAVMLLSAFFWTSCDIEDLNKPEASFTYSPASPVVAQEVRFVSNSKNASSYKWNFGDGETSSSQNPKHTYSATGTFSVQLTVSNSDNQSHSVSKTVVVSAAPLGTVIEHNQDITSDEVWKSEYVHLVKRNIEIKEATLTIEPGTMVRFADGAGLAFGYSSNVSYSKLVAQGTPDKRIFFTSNKVNPETASWRYIYFGNGASHESIMEYCDLSYGGTYSSTSGTVIVKETNIIFNHNTITHSASKGIECNDGGHFGSFTNNIIADNTGSSMGIEARYIHTLGAHNVIANTNNGINVYGEYVDIPGDLLWRNHGAKYTFLRDIYVGSVNGTNLTIEKGVTLVFNENKELNIGYENNKSAKLTAIGTPDAPIRFRSSKVNSSSGDWYWIRFGKYNDPTSKMEYCEIDAAGGGNYGAVYLIDTKIAFDHCKVTNSKASGIYLNQESSFESFTNNIISNSEYSSIKMPTQWAHTIGVNNNIANDGFGIAVYDNFSHNNNQSFTWLKQTCPYTLVTDVEIGSTQGCSLIIEPGTTIKLAQNKQLDVAYSDNKSGTLIAVGTADNKITFTSAAPTGDWYWIRFGTGSMQENALEYCNINNAGGGSYGAVVCYGINLDNTPSIKHCHISNSKSNGIYIDNSTPVLEDNTFEGNDGQDIYYN